MPTATVLGLAYESPIAEFPVRTGPGTNFDKAPFTISKGTTAEVITVDEDSQDTQSDFGRIYSWFELKFPDGNTGWMRGHVVGIQGDFSQFGYGNVAELTHAYKLIRDMSVAVPVPSIASEVSTPSASSEVSAPDASSEVSTPDASSEVSAPPPPAAAKKGRRTAKPSSPAMIVIQRQVGSALNARDAPGGANVIFRVPGKAKVKLVDVARDNTPRQFRWFKIDHEGQQAWVREDYTRWEGDTETLGLPWDLYPAPMKDATWWVRDFNFAPKQDTSTWEHWGWDFGCNVGDPIYCGPNGGRVVQVQACTKCTAAKPSTINHGLQLGDPSTFSDPGWGFGYGNFVVVGYMWDQLPTSTQEWMNANGYGNGAMFALYGHMHEYSVQAGQELTGETVIGSGGNTGNSEAPHLHLELRASKSQNYTTWAAIKSGLITPMHLFSR